MPAIPAIYSFHRSHIDMRAATRSKPIIRAAGRQWMNYAASIIDQPLDIIDEAALTRLIDNQVGERPANP
jgi:hypothetical protein